MGVFVISNTPTKVIQWQQEQARHYRTSELESTSKLMENGLQSFRSVCLCLLVCSHEYTPTHLQVLPDQDSEATWWQKNKNVLMNKLRPFHIKLLCIRGKVQNFVILPPFEQQEYDIFRRLDELFGSNVPHFLQERLNIYNGELKLGFQIDNFKIVKKVGDKVRNELTKSGNFQVWVKKEIRIEIEEKIRRNLYSLSNLERKISDLNVKIKSAFYYSRCDFRQYFDVVKQPFSERDTTPEDLYKKMVMFLFVLSDKKHSIFLCVVCQTSRRMDGWTSQRLPTQSKSWIFGTEASSSFPKCPKCPKCFNKCPTSKGGIRPKCPKCPKCPTSKGGIPQFV